MKLAVTGKGGVGKTTTASLLARLYASKGYSVLAVDANPDANLGAALGIPWDEIRKITPIAEMDKLIEERTGARPGSVGAYFKLNPRVDDIPDRFAITRNGIKLLIMGTVKKGGSGCICPESTVLKNLMNHLLLGRKEVVILDMDAGVEHIGRATAKAVDAFVVVVEPGMRSIETAKAIKRLAVDIGIEKTYVIGNKIRGDDDKQFVTRNLPDFDLLGFMDYNPKVIEADLKGSSAYDVDPAVVAEISDIGEKLEAKLRGAHK